MKNNSVAPVKSKEELTPIESPPSIVREKARLIDQSVLSPAATAGDIEHACQKAIRYGFKAVCVLPSRLEMTAKLLRGYAPLPITVIGFPLGGSTASNKVREAATAYRQGAEELDMVINLGAFKDKNHDAVRREIVAVIKETPLPVKVIIETCLLTDEEKVVACDLVLDAGADYIKTSTGYGTGGATAHDIALLFARLRGYVKIKASGGIHTAEAMEALLKAGADRIGTSFGERIIGEYAARDTAGGIDKTTTII